MVTDALLEKRGNAILIARHRESTSPMYLLPIISKAALGYAENCKRILRP